MFLQVDFGLVRNASGELEPKLVELQAFPSLCTEYQPTLARQYVESYGLPDSLPIYLGGYDHERYQQQMRELIVAGHDPDQVILLEIHPEKQNTLRDFLLTQRSLGIAIVDILNLKKGGDRLFYEKAGREIPGAASTTAALWTNWSARNRAAFSLSDCSRSQCGVGRPPELVLPHQQVLHSLSQACVRAQDMAA